MNRKRKYERYPKLVEKLRNRTKANRTFSTSLDPLSIPPVSAKWTVDNLPYLSKEILLDYLANKKQGSIGQQEKAHRMIQSRKIISVKTLSDENKLYVKVLIIKSYGHDSRPAYILFEDGKPQKGHCPCPIGASGLLPLHCPVIVYQTLLLYWRKNFGTDM